MCSHSLSLVSLIVTGIKKIKVPFELFIFSSDRLPRAKVFKGYANVGVTDTSKNVSKANQLKFTDSDVIFYPDNKNPGKL